MADAQIQDYQVLYDRVISVIFMSADGKDMLKINPSLGGPKADMTFEISLLPGNVFHDVTLTIRNFNLAYDIKKFTYMYITAGYREFKDDLGTNNTYKKIADKYAFVDVKSKSKQLTYDNSEGTLAERENVYDFATDITTNFKTFGIEIFYSYCLAPPPDGDTVFKGIVVSSDTSAVQGEPSPSMLSSTSALEVVNLSDQLSLRQYITLFCQAYSDATEGKVNISVDYSAIDNYTDSKGQPYINLDKILVSDVKDENVYGNSQVFSSPLVLFSSVKAMLDKYIMDHGFSLISSMTIMGTKVTMGLLDGSFDTENLENKHILKLDAISSAALNAGIMTVTAPWVPSLAPGDIIEVSRQYINGQELPNVIDMDEITGKDDRYRVLTMNIRFSSVSDTNSMDITAIPIKAAAGGDLQEVKKNFETTVSLIKEEGSEQTKTLVLGGEKEPYTNSLAKFLEQKVFPINPADNYINLRDFLGFNNDKTPNCSPTGVLLNRKVTYSTLCQDRYKNLGYMYALADKNPVYFGGEWLWPLVYALTYTLARKTENTNDIMYVWDEDGRPQKLQDVKPEFMTYFNRRTPIAALTGDVIFYPTIDTWMQLYSKYNIRLALGPLYEAAADLTYFKLRPKMKQNLKKFAYLLTNINDPTKVGFKGADE